MYNEVIIFVNKFQTQHKINLSIVPAQKILLSQRLSINSSISMGNLPIKFSRTNLSRNIGTIVEVQGNSAEISTKFNQFYDIDSDMSIVKLLMEISETP